MRSRSRTPWVVLAGTLAVSAGLVVSTPGEALGYRPPPTLEVARVSVKRVTARSGPGSSHEGVCSLFLGARVRILARRGEWRMFHHFSGGRGGRRFRGAPGSAPATSAEWSAGGLRSAS